MKRWLACATLALLLAPVWAASAATPVETLTRQFTAQERILLAGVLADPSESAEFARDAAGPISQAIFDKWRQRIALFSRNYLDGAHPTDENARSVQAMVPPAEWAMLMTSLKMLSNGGITDQAKFRIFMAMLNNANDDLQADPPDTYNAHKVIDLGRKKVSQAMRDYLASPTGKAALDEALRGQSQASAQAAAPKIVVKPLRPRVRTRSLAQVRAALADSPRAGEKVFDGANQARPLQAAPVASDAAPAPWTQAPRQPPPTLTLPSGLTQAAALPPPPAPAAPAPARDDLAALNQKVQAEHHGPIAAARLFLLSGLTTIVVGRLKRRKKKAPRPQAAPAGS